MDKVTIRFVNKQKYLDFCAKYAIGSEVELKVGENELPCMIAGFEEYHGAVQVHLRVKKGE